MTRFGKDFISPPPIPYNLPGFIIIFSKVDKQITPPRGAAHLDNIHKRQFDCQLFNSQNKNQPPRCWQNGCSANPFRFSFGRICTHSCCWGFLWGSKTKRTLLFSLVTVAIMSNLTLQLQKQNIFQKPDTGRGKRRANCCLGNVSAYFLFLLCISSHQHYSDLFMTFPDHIQIVWNQYFCFIFTVI